MSFWTAVLFLLELIIFNFHDGKIIGAFQINTIRPQKRRSFSAPSQHRGLQSSSLPPEADEFFQALDEWASRSQIRSKQSRNFNRQAEEWNDVVNGLEAAAHQEEDNGNDTYNKEETNGTKTTILDDLDLDEGIDEDAPFLDAEEYLELSRRTLGMDDDEMMEEEPTIRLPDQSFRDGLSNYVEWETVPDALVTNETVDIPEEDAIDRLLGLLRNKGRHASNYLNVSAAEELDQQVFAKEMGHQTSSPLFRSSLTNSSVQGEAIVDRRSRNFRERQAKGISKLEDVMSEFMEEFKNKDGDDQDKWDAGADDDDVEEDDLRLEIARCSVCRRILTASDLTNADKTELEICSVCKKNKHLTDERTISNGRENVAPNGISNGKMRPLVHNGARSARRRRSNPWISMVDPDTNEVFYFNQETEEMRWESPALEEFE